MQHWTRKNSRGGTRLRTDLEPQEAAVLRGMVSSVADMLAARSAEAPKDELSELTGLRTGHSSAPRDAGLARLLPDFHRLDQAGGSDEGAGPDAAAALRSLHEPDIIDAKRAAAGVLLDTCPVGGGKVSLTLEQADAWLATINDVRLSLGVMLDIGPHTPEELPEEDPRAGHFGVYQWLTFVQDSLVQELLD
ncbi:MAG: oxidative stress transcriptional regulator AosR [Mycobacteriaceae bacterium]